MKITISLDTIIGILALLVAIGSYVYTWWFNHYSVDLINLKVDEIYNNKSVSFEIVNLSTKSIKITSIVLLDNQGNEITDNGFSPKNFEKYQNSLKAKAWEEEHDNDFFPELNPYTSPLQSVINLSENESLPFEDSTYLKVDDSEYFSYFVDTLPNKIEIKSKQRINYFSKIKLFSTNFDQSD